MKVKETVGRISATVPPEYLRELGRETASGSGSAVAEMVASGIAKCRILSINAMR